MFFYHWDRRWLKTSLAQAGIDIHVYQAHSTRSASTSKAAGSLPVDAVMKLAGWSQESTFRKYYNKTVLASDEMSHLPKNSRQLPRFLRSNRKETRPTFEVKIFLHMKLSYL